MRLAVLLSLLILTSPVAAEDPASKLWIPEPAADFSVTAGLGKVGQGLVFCIGALLLGVGVYKKFVLKDGPKGSRRIIIKERTVLGPKSALILVEVDGKEMLLSTGSESANLIRVIDKESSLPYFSEEQDLCFDKALSENI